MKGNFKNKLKKITPLRKCVSFFKRMTYPKYRKLFDGLSHEMGDLRETVENENRALSSSGAGTARELNEVYKCLLKELFIIKYKMSEFNSLTNIMLYENELKSTEAKEDFLPKVSLIIPVYNGENYLEEAMDCAFRQTYPNLEVIVVNDGSTDDTANIARKYGDRIKYIEKENGGGSSALNAGIANMTGEYFAWLSHDDKITSDHIEKLVEYVSHHYDEKVIPYASFDLIDENGRRLTEESVNAKLNMFDYKRSVLEKYSPLLFGEINGGSVLIPKEVFDKYGLFDESRRITQEREMWYRLIEEYRFICLPYTTSSIRIHKDQVSRKKDLIAEKTNEKNLEIIDGIYEKMKTEDPDKASLLYQELYTYYNNNSNFFMADSILKRISEDKG